MSRPAPQELSGGPLAAVGGPLGRHASARALSWAATVVPLLVATSATMALSVAERTHCVAKGWVGSDQFWHACFSDLPALYQLGNLHAGLAAYVGGGGARSDHPVLTGAVMALVGGLVPDGAFLDQTRWYFALWALLGTALAGFTAYATAASRPRHVVDAAQVALSPVLLMTAMLSSDLFGVALVSGGVWAWSRRRPVLAGALLGLAVTARTYPVLVLLALVLLGLRTGRLASVGRTVGAAAVAVAVVLVPFLVGNPGAILRTYHVWWDSPANLGSPWMLPALLGHPLPPGATTLLATAGLVAAVGLGALFTLGTPRRPTVAEVALVVVAVALLTGKAFPVQSSLWLVPLVALAGTRWRDHLVWAGAEALHFVCVWLYVAGLSKPDRGLPAGWYAVALMLRLVAVGYLVWRVWQTASAREEARGRLSEDEVGPQWETGQVTGQVTGQATDGDTGSEADGDPDSDVVGDELAGDFSDAPDRLLVRLA
ncbi:glycosyltransferase 87 family protein [Pedococcus sp. 5OH_020]|uniref:glycosyltransferase 87 family protein n=1 Tax=Pedococcus sp. 5OH_020 TaxID=2989814 RepID=UPI0022E99B92|nr:glycosyltransferase 87 family protein [Pedococcus sp. 5OH_020]